MIDEEAFQCALLELGAQDDFNSWALDEGNLRFLVGRYESAKAKPEPLAVDEDLLETLAMLEHQQWEQWAKTIVTSEAISAERKARWFECFKPYHELTEEQKEHDRIWARKVMAYADRLPMRESSEDKLHELILRLARACDCASIVSCGNEDDKMFMLRVIDQVRDNITRHTGIKGFVEIWLAEEFPERYQLEQMPTTRPGDQ